MILFRHADPRWPFLWETDEQPPGRWHGDGDGPVQYLSDTPDGAWAEFLRHEEIKDPEDLVTVRRALWAIEVDESEAAAQPRLPAEVLTGGRKSYARCQGEATRLRAQGASRLSALSAALRQPEAGGSIGRSFPDRTERPTRSCSSVAGRNRWGGKWWAGVTPNPDC